MTSVLGASVPDPRTTTSNVNWNLDDTSDSTQLVNGKGVDDDGRSNSPWSSSNPAPPWAGPDYNPITVTISGLVANGIYELKMVSLGRRYDPVTDPNKILENRTDNGVNDYDFSYGASDDNITVNDASVGTKINEVTRDGNGAFGGNIYKPAHPSYVAYKFFQGLYANSMGLWQADASGQITLYVGQGVIHDKNANGARTQLDGIVVYHNPADLTMDGHVDLEDFALFARFWLDIYPSALAHRYTFNEGAGGDGTTIQDEVGGANGTLKDFDDPNLPGTQTFVEWGTGYLWLKHDTQTGPQKNDLSRGGAYIELPAGMLNAMRNNHGVTFEMFCRHNQYPWDNDNFRSSYFMFGNGNPASGGGDMFSLLSRNNEKSVIFYHGNNLYSEQWGEYLPKLSYVYNDVDVCVTVVVDNVANKVKFYYGGVLKGEMNQWSDPNNTMPGLKSTDDAFNDTVNYIGRGYEAGWGLTSSKLRAFNLYTAAMTDDQILSRADDDSEAAPPFVCAASVADMDQDCDVDTSDLAMFVAHWLDD
jgi:hypothetical protein